MTFSRRRDIGAAIFLFLVALGLWTFTTDLPRGTASRMGPGFFPLVLAALLVVCGVIVLLQAIAFPDAAADTRDDTEIDPASPGKIVKNTVLVIGALVLFAHGVGYFGLALTSFAVVLMTAQATTLLTLQQKLLLAAGLSAFSVLLFRFGLGLTMPVLPW